MKKTVLILTIVTLLSKVLGFIRDIILSYFYGVSSISDAYLISNNIPVTIFSFISVGIATSYIPMYINIVEKSGVQIADRFTSNIINVFMVLCSILILIVLILTVPIIKIFALGFEGETLDLAVNLTRISIFSIYFSTLISVFSGYLQVKGNFVIPALIGIPLNIITVVFIILSATFGVAYLAIGNVIAIISQLLVFVPFVHKKQYVHRLLLDVHSIHLKKMLYLSVPVIIGVSVNQINILVDKTLASQIVEGGISALNYANHLNLFIQGIFVMTTATVMYPMISRLASENNIIGFKRTVSEAIGIINLIVIPASVGVLLFAEPIVNLLFGRGAFNSEGIVLTSTALFFYSFGMIGYGLREILSRVFYAMQDTKTPMINAVIGMVINIILNIILSRYLGIGGLALATSISAIFTTVLLFICLRKKIGQLGIKRIFLSFIKVSVASLFMGLFAKLSFYCLLSLLTQNLAFLIAIAIGVITYFIIVFFMEIEEVNVIFKAIKKKFK